MIKVKKLNNKATFQKASNQDVGYDVTCCDIKYKEDGRIVLDLGIQVEPPDGFYFEIVPRSSFSKTGFIMANSVGIIDPEYRGNWKMMIRYLEGDTFGLVKEFTDIVTDTFLNKRVAQAILRKFNTHQEIEFVEELSETNRGSDGFGSTGE